MHWTVSIHPHPTILPTTFIHRAALDVFFTVMPVKGKFPHAFSCLCVSAPSVFTIIDESTFPKARPNSGKFIVANNRSRQAAADGARHETSSVTQTKRVVKLGEDYVTLPSTVIGSCIAVGRHTYHHRVKGGSVYVCPVEWRNEGAHFDS